MFEFVKTFSSLISDLDDNDAIQQQKKLYFVLGNESAGSQFYSSQFILIIFFV